VDEPLGVPGGLMLMGIELMLEFDQLAPLAVDDVMRSAGLPARLTLARHHLGVLIAQ
jgi:hypothetical protein